MAGLLIVNGPRRANTSKVLHIDLTLALTYPRMQLAGDNPFFSCVDAEHVTQEYYERGVRSKSFATGAPVATSSFRVVMDEDVPLDRRRGGLSA